MKWAILEASCERVNGFPVHIGMPPKETLLLIVKSMLSFHIFLFYELLQAKTGKTFLTCIM